MVDTTSSCNDSLARKWYSSMMSMEGWQFLTTPRWLQDWINRTSLTKLRTRSEGIQNLKYFVDWLWVLQINKNHWRVRWTMGHEAHLNIYQKVFVYI
jgi:hypothetical protein